MQQLYKCNVLIFKTEYSSRSKLGLFFDDCWFQLVTTMDYIHGYHIE